ncbi:hypothetical protein V1J52_13885 [Streptomyces sp. TRM 70351]|uniref:hypothetical protein n=1 Tax=Streptomyces sp. TRM 70351 TaxID=3116552 RepID=UPI002E7C042B|nr:hypothetical protein [Streptomyces sp. TRM 70351]MEE1929255.1 hypothetical protein [Streptomyces sp. TRM 70351]
MTGYPEPSGYWCDVRAEGFVYGTGESVPYVLGTFPTISPVLALRWLRSQALRIADRLDPDPQRSAWVRPFMRRPSVPAPDCPTGLRAWVAEPDGERMARAHVKAGHPLCVAFPDEDCTYTLSVWPVHLPADEPAQPIPEPIRHRIGQSSHSSYVLAEAPWGCAAAVPRVDGDRRYETPPPPHRSPSHGQHGVRDALCGGGGTNPVRHTA